MHTTNIFNCIILIFPIKSFDLSFTDNVHEKSSLISLNNSNKIESSLLKFYKISNNYDLMELNKNVYVRPTKIKISRRIRAVWSESSMDTFWIAEDAKFILLYIPKSFFRQGE